MVAAGDIPDRCVVIATLRLPTYNPTTFGQHSVAMHASDFSPIANLRLLYKVFAYLILGRIEHTLDTYQPEEQHGFRSKYRLEEHLLTANLVLHKTTAHGIPVWLVSWYLSKAFDRVHWPTLWNALRAQGISDHMIWMLSKVYEGQSGEVARGAKGTVVLGSHFLSLCAEPERLRCIAFI